VFHYLTIEAPRSKLRGMRSLLRFKKLKLFKGDTVKSSTYHSPKRLFQIILDSSEMFYEFPNIALALKVL